MAHEIFNELCVYSLTHGGIPWHNIGTGLDEITHQDVLKLAGFNRQITCLPITLNTDTVVASQSGALQESIEGYRATLDTSTGRVLGIVTDKYAPLQPQELLAAAEFLVKEFGARYSLAAQLRGGKREILSLQLPDSSGEIVAGDVVKSYFNLANGHDGKLAACVGSSDIRVVCQNTLSAWLAEGAVQIRHRGGVEKALAHAVTAFTMEAKVRREFYTAMTERVMMPEDVVAYFDKCLGEAKVTTAPVRGRKSLRTRMTSILDANGLIGVDTVCGLPGTLWGAFNAVTQLATHDTYSANPLDSLYFGGGSKLLVAARTHAVALMAA